jgi:hypothetical protein
MYIYIYIHIYIYEYIEIFTASTSSATITFLVLSKSFICNDNNDFYFAGIYSKAVGYTRSNPYVCCIKNGFRQIPDIFEMNM